MPGLDKNTAKIKDLYFRTLENATDAVYWIDPEARIRQVNKAACDLLGYTGQELTSLTIFDINEGYDREKWLERWARLRQEGALQFETTHKTKDGVTTPVEIKAVYIEFDGEPYICKFARDISERKKIEQLLRKSESNLAEAQRLTHIGSWDWDIVDNELFWSDEIYRIFGLTTRDFGATYEAFLASVHPDDREYVENSVNNALYRNIPYNIEHRIILPDGETRMVNERAEVFFDDSNKPVRMIGTVQDITEAKHAEEALRQALSEVEQLKTRLQAENIYLQEEIKTEHNFDEIISRNETLKKTLRKVEQVASTDATVLILGETGTGKELFARAIHNISKRRDRPLVKVNCAALPVNLIESELFGHEKGAFTGALSRKIGRFELAHKGTIFLDEIGDLPLDLQTKFLRILQDGQFERVGGSETLKIDVRIIAATNRNLEEAIRQNAFREDLYYRLNVFPIKIIPLRERREDIPILISHFAQKYGAKIGKKIESVSHQVIDILQNYHWPGNVRELENVIERAVILARDSVIRLDDLPPNLSAKEAVDFKITDNLHQVEKNHIIKILEACNWVIDGKRGAARKLDLPPSSLRDRMKRLGIKRP